MGGLLGLGIAGVITSALQRVPVMFISLRRLSVPFWVLAASVLLSMMVGVASSFFPAWNASRRPIVTCLRFTD
jgi:ABC-type antimicrobial peptide transport system permease subunit